MAFAGSKEIGGYVVAAFGKAPLCGGELVHEDNAETVLFTQSGFIARSLNRAELTEEFETNRFEEIPILSAASE